jgi:hypothetical protein
LAEITLHESTWIFVVS